MRSAGISFEREIVNASSVPGVTIVKVPVGYSKGIKFAGGGSVDFVGVIHGVPVALEAKSCRGSRFSLSRITDRQIEFMRRWESSGGKSAVLLRFGFRHVVVLVIPLRLLLIWIGRGKKSITSRDISTLPRLGGNARRWDIETIPQLLEEFNDRLGHIQQNNS